MGSGRECVGAFPSGATRKAREPEDQLKLCHKVGRSPFGPRRGPSPRSCRRPA
jgi:hypothetical protein